jgi:ABC-2 type transport system ATP-binding protein
MMLRVQNLDKQFADVKAVDNLSFELDEGKICGFVGPNGAGKTTTMRMIATLEEPTGGEIFIDETPLSSDPYRMRRLMGFMPDHYGTYPSMTVADYLHFYARAYEVEASARDRRIRGIMDFTGLDKLEERQVEVLSKGQRQRLNLGRALINDPRLLIMDEPAAGLDPRARVELRVLMKHLAEQGKTLFVSSHILTELAEVCDSMLIIDRGRTVSFGSFEEIRSRLQGKAEAIVRLIDAESVARLERFLLERAEVDNVRVSGPDALRFAMAGEREAIVRLLREIVSAGFPVVEFRPQTMTMEDVFIRITEGGDGE